MTLPAAPDPTFWCSIAVLCFWTNQYRDAAGAYLWATGINPYISEVQFDLGSLCESCCSQIFDSTGNWHLASRHSRPDSLAFGQRPVLPQSRGAEDAYLQATRINPYISEVRFDLGSLCDSHHSQMSGGTGDWRSTFCCTDPNPWYSIVILHFQTSQDWDASDAYPWATRINPHISEI